MTEHIKWPDFSNQEAKDTIKELTTELADRIVTEHSHIRCKMHEAGPSLDASGALFFLYELKLGDGYTEEDDCYELVTSAELAGVEFSERSIKIKSRTWLEGGVRKSDNMPVSSNLPVDEFISYLDHVLETGIVPIELGTE